MTKVLFSKSSVLRGVLSVFLLYIMCGESISMLNAQPEYVSAWSSLSPFHYCFMFYVFVKDPITFLISQA